jgi:hypothetical protein
MNLKTMMNMRRRTRRKKFGLSTIETKGVLVVVSK